MSSVGRSEINMQRAVLANPCSCLTEVMSVDEDHGEGDFVGKPSWCRIRHPKLTLRRLMLACCGAQTLAIDRPSHSQVECSGQIRDVQGPASRCYSTMPSLGYYSTFWL